MLLQRNAKAGTISVLAEISTGSSPAVIDRLQEVGGLASPAGRRAADLAPQWTRSDTGPMLDIPLLGDDGEIFNLLIVIEPKAATGLDPARHDAATLVQQHWLPLVRLWQRSAERDNHRQSFENALDFSANAYMLVDCDRNLLFGNKAARALLTRGQSLMLANGKPTAVRLPDALRLSEMLSHVIALAQQANAAADQSCPVLMLPSPDTCKILCVIKPVKPAPRQRTDPAALIVALQPYSDVNRLIKPNCDAYGLSAVETRLAALLVAGSSMGDASAAMSVKKETARGYLKTIFLKTDTHRQSELIQLIMSYTLRVDADLNLQFVG